MKCCGEYVLISSENMFCDKCNKIYTLFEEDIITPKTYQKFEDYNIKNNEYNIYKEYLARNYIPLKTQLYIESKFSFIKSCIYSKDCQIMSIIFISISVNDKLIPIKYFFNQSGLLCGFNMFKKCVDYFIKLLSLSITYDHKKLILFYEDFFNFNFKDIINSFNKISKIKNLSINLFTIVPIAILLNISGNNFKSEIKLMSEISYISLPNLKKKLKITKNCI